MWVYFWALYSVPLIYVSVLTPVPCCFHYYGLRAEVPNLLGTRDQFFGRQFFQGQGGKWRRKRRSGSEASGSWLAGLSCFSALCLTHQGQVPVLGPRIGRPFPRALMKTERMKKKSDEGQFARDRKPIYFYFVIPFILKIMSIFFKIIISFWQNSFPRTTAQGIASPWNSEMNFS